MIFASDTSTMRNALVYTDKEHNLHVSGTMGDCFAPSLFNSPSTKLQLSESVSFFQNGYFTLHNAVDNSARTAARRYIDSKYEKWIKISKRQDDWRCHLQLDISNLDSTTPTQVEHAPILDLILKSPAIMHRLRCMMSAEPSGIFYSQVAYRTPVTKKAKSKVPGPDYVPGAEYHLDGSANSSGTRFPDPWTVMVGVALVDIETLDMGNFTVFPGSHVVRDWSSYPEEKIAKTLPDLGATDHIRLPAGGVVFAHVLLAHRGGKNVKRPDAEVSTYTSADGEMDGVDGEDEVVEKVTAAVEETQAQEEEEAFVPQHIPRNTREMVFIRVQAAGIDYMSPERSENVLRDPWYEFSGMVQEHNLQ